VGLWRKIRRTGRVAEPAPPRPAEQPPGAGLCGSVQLGHVDAGSCNGCEIEIGSAFGPVYDAPGSTSYEAGLTGRSQGDSELLGDHLLQRRERGERSQVQVAHLAVGGDEHRGRRAGEVERLL
jgi:hypothetical protein